MFKRRLLAILVAVFAVGGVAIIFLWVTAGGDPRFTVTVNYGRSLKDLVAAGGYTRVDSAITDERFPRQGNGVATAEVIMVRAEQSTKNDEMAAEMESRGLRPARIEHLLAFGEQVRRLPRVAMEWPAEETAASGAEGELGHRAEYRVVGNEIRGGEKADGQPIADETYRYDPYRNEISSVERRLKAAGSTHVVALGAAAVDSQGYRVVPLIEYRADGRRVLRTERFGSPAGQPTHDLYWPHGTCFLAIRLN
ncbi:MAG: hypothetical protein HYS13_16370 [Planctomycetia bacterium]|nr:hypothetical protein [Planctomycetia bacterium]